jgi:hypothetical protein
MFQSYPPLNSGEKVKPIEWDKLRLIVAFLKRKYGLLADQVTLSTNLKRSSTTQEINKENKKSPRSIKTII